MAIGLQFSSPMGFRGAMLLAAVFAAGCGGTDVSGADAGPVADADVNAPDADTSNTTNLRFQFKAEPEVPGDVGGPFKVELTTVEIQLADVRAIGDVAPGDSTRRASFALTWVKSEKETLEFRGAPPGLYSSLRAQIVSYRFTGTVELTEGDKTGFVITDAPSPSLSVSTSFAGVRLDPGETKTREIEVELKDVLQELPWSDLSEGADPIVVDETTEEIVDIRNDLADAFEAES